MDGENVIMARLSIHLEEDKDNNLEVVGAVSTCTLSIGALTFIC